MMFFRRRKPIKYDLAPSIWNGWTERLITKINGNDVFTFRLKYFGVTGSFDGERYAHGVRFSDKECEDYAKMPLAFSEMPTGIPKERYAEFEGCGRGQEMRFGIRCNLDVTQMSLSSIASKEGAGFLVLTSEDLVTNRSEGQDFITPTIQATLYDPDGSLMATIRQSFAAASARRGLPEIRVLLADKIQVNVDDFAKQTHRSYKIQKIITWETWGSDPDY